MTHPDSPLGRTLAAITGADADARAAAEAHQLAMLKPPGSLGELETLGCRLAAIAGTCPPPVPAPALVTVFAGDHGVQTHGPSPWPQEVTAQMAAGVAGGGAAVSVLARHAGADVAVYDVGMVTALPEDAGVHDRRIAAGTADMTVGPALTPAQCTAAIEVGLTVAADAVARGHRCLVPGEVGIGNTTAAAALVSVFTGLPPAESTGAGAGAAGERLARKKALVARAIDVNGATAADPLAALAAVGGLEHAAIVGVLLGAAAARVPVVLDGVNVLSAALVAAALAPAASDFWIAGHEGAEPGCAAALAALGLRPVLRLGLRLGEGSGAVTALPVVAASATLMAEMATFASAGIAPGA
ncbi:nicotinate-nucleotide--dimethylbenzimidazole phosphoribosyltransferase [Propioniciclava soli]|uniref:Nicotinate-nucleotide--dimethylbenzimidazole phosphoribosyltransferase n=1 Tax=Propioniciclava soli TaxID=2775081 RepID=A0ABZ3C8W0_9ACTN|nr:nicotinate-nucleotide--dimethylbenzimidazole phosphoribosyltransferase [Propioniciclava soli]